MDNATDPNCSICDSTPGACVCEAEELERAVLVAEEKMLHVQRSAIRDWVKQRARDCVLKYFKQLANHRAEENLEVLHQLAEYHAFHYNAPTPLSELARVDAEFRQMINEDWKMSVQRYPEVLDYYYDLVEISVPDINDDVVVNPPFDSCQDFNFSTPRDLIYENSTPESRPNRRRRSTRHRESAYSVEEPSETSLTTSGFSRWRRGRHRSSQQSQDDSYYSEQDGSRFQSPRHGNYSYNYRY